MKSEYEFLKILQSDITEAYSTAATICEAQFASDINQKWFSRQMEVLDPIYKAVSERYKSVKKDRNESNKLP